MRTLLLLLTSVLLLAVGRTFVPGGYFSLREEGTASSLPATSTESELEQTAGPEAEAPAASPTEAPPAEPSATPVAPSSTPVLIVQIPPAGEIVPPVRVPVDIGVEVDAVVEVPGTGQAADETPTAEPVTPTAQATATATPDEPEATATATATTPALTPTPAAPTAEPSTPTPTPTGTPPETVTPTTTPPATETATAAPTEEACGEDGAGSYGPVSGTVSEEGGNSPDGPAPDEVAAADYEVTITFENPEWSPWDYGIAFRDTSDGSINVLALTSDGLWIHALRRPGETSGHEVLDGNSLLGLRTSPGSLNTLRLIVSDGTAEVHVNESTVTTITLSTEAGEAVEVQPFLGFIGDGMEGPVAYDEFTIICQ